MKFSVKSLFNAINLLPVLVLCLGLGASYYLWDLAYQLAKQEQRQRFDVRASEIEILIKQRLQTYAQVLYGGRALFTASEQVSRQEFKRYITELQIERFYPGIQGVGFSLLIPPAEKTQHIAKVRAEGFPNYTIYPQGQRAIYSSVLYLEPFKQKNLRAFGYDMYADVVRRTAMDRAWDENEVALSGKVRLVQEVAPNVQAGFLMYFPLYRQDADISTLALRRANLIGWIYAPFRMNDFMTAVLGKNYFIKQDADIDIYDGETQSIQTLLYNGENDDLDYTNSLFVVVKTITVFGQSWTLHIHSHPDFEAKVDLRDCYVIVTVGVTIMLILTLITWFLVKGRKRSFVAAQQMTAELQERDTRYQQMFEGSCSMAVLLDPDNGNIIDANPAASSFWGYSIEQLRSMNLSDINVMPLKQLLPSLQTALQHSQHIVTQHRLSDGAFKDVEVYSNAIVYQGRMVIHAILHDITERKQQEEEIKRLSCSELNKAKLEAEQANRAKSEFLSSMSHEVRTPMNAILGFAQLLQAEELTTDQHDSVKEILTSGAHLLDLINQVLDLSKIESGMVDLTLEKVNLVFLIKNCLSLLRTLQIKNNVQIINNIVMTEGCYVLADSLRLKQVLLNLISNAIKYNRLGGKITLSGQFIDADTVRINIIDTGSGLSEAQMAKLFQPFERLGAKNSAIEGTGIGLCISKKLIESMNGTIGVTSVEGEGSCFWIEIPRA